MARKTKKKHARVPVQPRAASEPRRDRRHPPRPTAPRVRTTGTVRARSPRRLYALSLGAAVLAGAALIGLSQISVHRGTAGAGASGIGVTGARATAAMLRGVPQRGNVLGSAAAPVRIVEYADLQCPFCARFAQDVLPALVRDEIRAGQLQVVFRGLAFLGPDSVTALRTAVAAGFQNRMWNVVELLFRNQGPENAWLSDGLLRSIVSKSGAASGRVFTDRDGAAVTSAIARWSQQADAAGVRAAPTFFIGPRGGALEVLAQGMPTVEQVRAAIDGALRK